MLVSCGEKDFVAKKNVDENSFLNTRGSDVISGCNNNFNYNKPKVDFLFVWDNSPSTKFIDDSTINALNGILDSFSPEFEKHVLIAPMNYLSDEKDQNLFFIKDSQDWTSSKANSILTQMKNVTPKKYLKELMPKLGNGFGYEQGVERARQLLNDLRGDGIFRNNAYTIIVVMSTGDIAYDIPPGQYATFSQKNAYINKKVSEFNALKTNMNAEQLRFMSISAHSECKSGYRIGYGYQQVSKLLNPSQNDAWNICTQSFSRIFEEINNNIQSEKIRHKYDHWAITPVNVPNFDVNDITVKDTNGNIIPQSTTNGWQYLGYTTRDRKYYPERGDSYTGLLIQLFGTARLDFGECLEIITREPIIYYGYLLLNSKPLEDSINLSIDGQIVPRADLGVSASQRNGWEYIGQQINQNVKVKSASEFMVEGTPAEYRSGYMIRLYGRYIIDNTKVTKYQIQYLPTSD